MKIHFSGTIRISVENEDSICNNKCDICGDCGNFFDDCMCDDCLVCNLDSETCGCWNHNGICGECNCDYEICEYDRSSTSDLDQEFVADKFKYMNPFQRARWLKAKGNSH